MIIPKIAHFTQKILNYQKNQILGGNHHVNYCDIIRSNILKLYKFGLK